MVGQFPLVLTSVNEPNTISGPFTPSTEIVAFSCSRHVLLHAMLLGNKKRYLMWNRGKINKIKDEISNNNAKRKSPAEHPWSWVTSPWKLERRAPYRGLWWRPRHDSEEMKMPVKNLACGHMYDKASIERCHSRAERRLTLHSSRVSRQEVSMEWPGSRRPREPSRRGSLNRTSLT